MSARKTPIKKPPQPSKLRLIGAGLGWVYIIAGVGIVFAGGTVGAADQSLFVQAGLSVSAFGALLGAFSQA